MGSQKIQFFFFLDIFTFFSSRAQFLEWPNFYSVVDCEGYCKYNNEVLILYSTGTSFHGTSLAQDLGHSRHCLADIIVTPRAE